MSRVGKLPVQIPAGVKVEVSDGRISVQGPKGSLSEKLPPAVTVEIDGSLLQVARQEESRRGRSMHGLARKLIANMVQGAHTGFSRTLEIVGVGYRAEPRGKALYLNLGFSHPILFHLPPEVTAKVEKQTVITLESPDRQMLGQTAAMIRALRPPEPYKGKGIKYSNEALRRKAGKAAGAAGG